MDEELTFGTFLRAKRLSRNISLRALAGMLELSPVHMSNMENDRRPAPKGQALLHIVETLELDKDEAERMYDLAAKSKSIPSVAADLPEYIAEKDIVRVALRKAKDADATDAEWQEFIERLEQRIVRDAEPETGGEDADD